MGNKDIRDYITGRYQEAMKEFRLAKDEDDRFRALGELSRLSNIAAEMYGFDFADSLRGQVECE